MNDEKNNANMKVSAAMKSQTPASPGKRLAPMCAASAGDVTLVDCNNPLGGGAAAQSGGLTGQSLALEARDRRERVVGLADDPQEPGEEADPIVDEAVPGEDAG